MASPDDIRADVRRLRAELKPEIVAEWSRLAFERMLSAIPRLRKPEGLCVALYRPLKGEPDFRPFEASLEAGGARLAFPRIPEGGSGKMELAAPAGSGDWVRATFGIEQPGPRSRQVDLSEVDLILVPGLAFGLRGERIGRGAGHYDRFLAEGGRAARAAVAWDFQVFPDLPQNPWDQRVHWIFTQSREIRPDDAGSLLR